MINSKPTVYFRADGNQQMGLGHIYRCLAIAEMINQDFTCRFMIRNPLASLKQQLLSYVEEVIALPDSKNNKGETEWICDQYLKADDIVVLDGYHFDTAYQQAIKDKGCRLVCIDDISDCHFVADVVINHTGTLADHNYSISPETQLCLGAEYAILRSEFCTAAQNRKNRVVDNPSVFICLGGADPDNDTIRVLNICKSKNTIKECYVVTGAAYAYTDKLNDYCQKSKMKIHLLSNLNAEQMVCYMSKCGMAITTPSSISYEYLSVGGILYLHQIADNQSIINRYLNQQGLAFPLDEFLVKENHRLTKAIAKQAELFTGKSRENILKLFKKLPHVSALSID